MDQKASDNLAQAVAVEQGRTGMKIFFIADTHFGEEAILRYENRPFKSVAEMDSEMILRWNAVVGRDDLVYHLGDFGASGEESDVLAKLNGTKYLVKGNHDTQSNEFYRSAGFSEVYNLPVLFEDFWLLSHAPVYVNENMPYANLFGHVHNSPLVNNFSKQHYCVSVERINYQPISFEHIKQAIQEASE